MVTHPVEHQMLSLNSNCDQSLLMQQMLDNQMTPLPYTHDYDGHQN